MHVVFPCQVLCDCYGKKKEKGGVFVNLRETSSRDLGGLLNCESDSLATLVAWRFVCFDFSCPCHRVSLTHSGNKQEVVNFAEKLRGKNRSYLVFSKCVPFILYIPFCIYG